jgi:hypothetical protein
MAVNVGSPSFVRADADHLTSVTHLTLADALKEVEVLAIKAMIADGTVASDEGHVALLAFASIEKEAIVGPLVLVAVRLTGLTREEEDDRLISRGTDPTLSLATE